MLPGGKEGRRLGTLGQGRAPEGHWVEGCFPSPGVPTPAFRTVAAPAPGPLRPPGWCGRPPEGDEGPARPGFVPSVCPAVPPSVGTPQWPSVPAVPGAPPGPPGRARGEPLPLVVNLGWRLRVTALIVSEPSRCSGPEAGAPRSGCSRPAQPAVGSVPRERQRRRTGGFRPGPN